MEGVFTQIGIGMKHYRLFGLGEAIKGLQGGVDLISNSMDIHDQILRRFMDQNPCDGCNHKLVRPPPPPGPLTSMPTLRDDHFERTSLIAQPAVGKHHLSNGPAM